VTEQPRPVHTHIWNGGVLPAWLDGHHHDDYGRLIIHTPNGPTRPEAGWWLIGWTDGTVTAASPWTGRHVYGPDGIAARLERAEATLAAARALHTRALRMEALVCARCGGTWPCATIRALDEAAPAAAEQSARTTPNNPPTSKETP